MRLAPRDPSADADTVSLASGSGLEDQLLGQVVAEERPDLEEARNQLIVSNAKMRQELKDIEDQILYRLSSSQGNPVDDTELIKVLEASKTKAAEIQVGPPSCLCSCSLPASQSLMPLPTLHPRPRSGSRSRRRRTLTSCEWSTYPWPSAPRSSSSVCPTWPTWTPCTSTPSNGSSASSSRASPTQRGQVALAHTDLVTQMLGCHPAQMGHSWTCRHCGHIHVDTHAPWPTCLHQTLTTEEHPPLCPYPGPFSREVQMPQGDAQAAPCIQGVGLGQASMLLPSPLPCRQPEAAHCQHQPLPDLQPVQQRLPQPFREAQAAVRLPAVCPHHDE